MELGRLVAPSKGSKYFVNMAVLNLVIILRTTAKAPSHCVVNMLIIKQPRKISMKKELHFPSL